MFKRDIRLTVAQDALCGAVSGVTARTLTAPIDVTKVLYQVGVPAADRCAFVGGGTLSLVRHVAVNEGVRGLFKGNFTSCLKMFPSTMVQFATYTSLKGFIGGEKGYLTLTEVTCISAAAGYTSTIFTYPLDTIKTRLIAQSSGKNQRFYKGILECWRHLLQVEGVMSLWRGMSAALLATIPSTMALFLTYELIQLRWAPEVVASAVNETFQEGMRIEHGITAALISLVCTHPLDTCRKKMQAYSSRLECRGGVDFHVTGLRQCWLHVWRTKWWLGLYAGFAPAVVKLMAFNLILMWTYMKCKEACLRYNGVATTGHVRYITDHEDLEYILPDVPASEEQPTVADMQRYIEEQEYVQASARHSRFPRLAKHVFRKKPA
ncbi:solute carrier family 25 member 43-like [Mya arenaria]|nr:solute carrier family 25 member 43-like [Mya arenaria]